MELIISSTQNNTNENPQENPTNNIITTIDERLYTIMKEEMNTNEQQHFIESFKIYLKYGNDDTRFVINFDDIWKWVGFSRKDPAKRFLLNKFTENIHYIYNKELHHVVDPINKVKSCDNEVIMLNVSTFKKYCMKASTKRADEICDYYLKMEMIMYKYTEEKMTTLTLAYEDTKNKLSKFIEYDDELFWNENEVSNYNNKNVIYVAFIGIFNNERIYKFGKSEQIYTREFKQHQKFFNIFKMKHVEESDNMSFVEKEFKKNLKSKNLLRTIEIKLSNITELFTISEQHTIDTLLNSLKILVVDNPLPAVKLLQEELLVKNNKIEELTNENIKINKLYQDLKLKSNKNITNEIIEPINEIIETTNNNVEVVEKSMNEKHQGPYVQVYESSDITKLLIVYPSITDATRKVQNSSFTQIKFAATNKLVYLNYRWFLVDRTDNDPSKVREIGETVIHKQKKIGIIAMLNREKTIIKKVFITQKEAADSINQCASAVCTAIRFNSILNDHYWYMWDTIDSQIQDIYLVNNILPTRENTCSKAVRIQQLDSTTGDIINTYDTITDVVKKLGISSKTIKKYSNNGEVYSGFKWKIL